MTQGEAIEPPLYYYLLAPVAWFTHGSDKIYALRIAERRAQCDRRAGALPHAARGCCHAKPLAAGLAAVILASFTGITHLLSQVQNDALLLPVCVALMWTFLHDIERRQVSVGTAWPPVPRRRRSSSPCRSAQSPSSSPRSARLAGIPRWRDLRQQRLASRPLRGTALELDRTERLPLSRALPSGGRPAGFRPCAQHRRRAVQPDIRAAPHPEWISLDTSYSPMSPPGPPDGRPMGLLGVAAFVALALVLCGAGLSHATSASGSGSWSGHSS